MEVAVATQVRPTTRATHVSAVVIGTVMFAFVVALRFLSTTSFSNDEYVSLAGAQQILFGEWPTRDFLDTGAPLMYTASAASQLVFGRTLFAEAMLTALAFAFAAVLTMVGATRLSGSLAVGACVAVVEIAFFPRGYAYPKLLLYAAAPLLIWWYQRRPASRTRMLALAAFVQVAFLFRHDHGLLIGAAAAVAVGVGDGASRSMRTTVQRLVTFGLLLLLLAAPYLVYLGSNGGIVRYFARGVAVSAAEAAGNHLTTPPFGLGVTLEKNYEAFLFALSYVLPLISAIVLVTFVRKGPALAPSLAQVAPLIVLAVMVNRAFLRDELWTRLVDAYVPAALLFAWLCGETARVGSGRLRMSYRAAAWVLTLLCAVSVWEIGRVPEQLNRAGLFGGVRRLPERFAERSEQLHERFNEHQMPSRATLALVPFFQYVDRCTTVGHRLLLPGHIPEVAVYAGRLVAGGRLTMLAGYNDATDDRRELQERLNRQLVPYVLVTPNDKATVWSAYPEIATLVRSHYRPLVTYTSGDGGDPVVEVFVSQILPPRGTDSTTGWPCFV
jgi:hypothetical protein